MKSDSLVVCDSFPTCFRTMNIIVKRLFDFSSYLDICNTLCFHTLWMFYMVFVFDNRVKYKCSSLFNLIRHSSRLNLDFFVSTKRLWNQALIFICEIVCGSISTCIYKLMQTNAMLIKDRLQIYCRGNNESNRLLWQVKWFWCHPISFH